MADIMDAEFNRAIVRVCTDIEKAIAEVRETFKDKVKDAEYCLSVIYTKTVDEHRKAAERLGNLISQMDFEFKEN